MPTLVLIIVGALSNILIFFKINIYKETYRLINFPAPFILSLGSIRSEFCRKVGERGDQKSTALASWIWADFRPPTAPFTLPPQFDYNSRLRYNVENKSAIQSDQVMIVGFFVISELLTRVCYAGWQMYRSYGTRKAEKDLKWPYNCRLWTIGRSDLIDSDRLLATRIKFKNGVTECECPRDPTIFTVDEIE